MPKTPTFSELATDDATALLARNHVGRLAYTFKDRVDIEPISYVYRDGWIHARTAPGAKLTTVHHNPWVAFEVDEVKSRYDWKSVVARGTIYFPDPDRGGPEQEAYESSVKILRSVDADAMTQADATPHRQSILRIHIDEITGRGASE